MLTASILAAAAALSVSQMDTVIILRRGDIPLEGSGVSKVWIEYEVRRSAGGTSKMYLTYLRTPVQSIPDPGETCHVIFVTGLVDGTVYGANHQIVGVMLEDALIIEDLRCDENSVQAP